MNKYIFPIIKWKIKPWLKYYILNKKSAPSYPLSEIIEGTSPLTLENSIRKKFHIFNVGGNTKQQSYTGKNLLNVSENLSITRVKTVSISLPAGTYHLTCGTVSKGGTDDPHIVIGSYHNAIVSNSNYTFTISSNVTSISIYSNGYSYDASKGITSTINQLMISEAGGDYEPYVGGQASPNPSYPQEIENVSGEVEVKVENKNLCYSVSVPSGNKTVINFFINKNYIEKTFNIAFTPNVSLSNNSLYCNVDGQSIGLITTLTTTANTRVVKAITLSDSNYEKIKNGSSVYFQLYKNGATFAAPEDAQIQNETITDYEPHEEQTATLSLPEGMEMCKIGTYVDIFTKSGNNWIVPNKILKIASYNGETITTPYISTTGGLDIGATVYYVGSEDYIVTDPTLISDLNNLKNLYSYKGTTHISSSNEPSPIFEVQYYMEEGA